MTSRRISHAEAEVLGANLRAFVAAFGGRTPWVSYSTLTTALDHQPTIGTSAPQSLANLLTHRSSEWGLVVERRWGRPVREIRLALTDQPPLREGGQR